MVGLIGLCGPSWAHGFPLYLVYGDGCCACEEIGLAASEIADETRASGE
jgi:hypothetical protein